MKVPPNVLRLLPALTTSSQSSGPRSPLFRPLDVATSGMSVQRLRLETAATNIANAETTRTEGGGPYRRRVVQAEEVVRGNEGAVFPPLPLESRGPADPTISAGGVRAIAIEEDTSEGPLVYDPGHPDANAAGYVRMPNVSITEEIVTMMDARRIYEANATVFQAAKQLLRRALDI
ncbi:MAG: flagellar basal body rod protein FlgC [Gemmatimonadota bacterium]